MSKESGALLGQLSDFFRTKKLILCVLAAILGCLLMLWGGGERKNDVQTTSGEYDTSMLEERVAQLCSRVNGVDNVSVMITVDTVSEKLYATNSQYGSDYVRNEYVTLSGGLLPIGERAMTVRGVAVVCDGGDDASVKLTLTKLICSLFSISSDRVSVVGAKTKKQ